MSAFVVRILALTGSGSRDILQPLTDNDQSNETFAWLSVQAGEVGYARDVRLIRVSYAGELGWELHHPVSCNRHLTDLLIRASAKAPDRRIARIRLGPCEHHVDQQFPGSVVHRAASSGRPMTASRYLDAASAHSASRFMSWSPSA